VSASRGQLLGAACSLPLHHRALRAPHGISVVGVNPSLQARSAQAYIGLQLLDEGGTASAVHVDDDSANGAAVSAAVTDTDVAEIETAHLGANPEVV